MGTDQSICGVVSWYVEGQIVYIKGGEAYGEMVMGLIVLNG